jgi:DNA-binding NtrC family response regulator
LPSLRERRDDIPLLVAHFLKGKSHPRSQQPFQLTRRAMEILCAYDWPGNVRELENAIERATTLCESDTIQAADLPPSMLASVKTADPSLEATATATLPTVSEAALYPLHANPALAGGPAHAEPLLPLKSFLREQEQAYLSRALQHCGGDKEKAAILLGVSLATLYRKLSGEDRE